MNAASPRFPHVRAIVFDLDGVLIDSEIANVRAAALGFAAVGVTLDPADHGRIVGRHPFDYLPELARRYGVAAVDLRRVATAQAAAYARLALEPHALPGALETVRAFGARGKLVGLATSSERENVRAILSSLGIADAFRAVLTRDDVKRSKPDPEIYRLAASRLGVSPGDALAVEDSPHGVAAAKGAGLHCVAVRSPHVDPARLGAADALADDLPAVLALVG